VTAIQTNNATFSSVEEYSLAINNLGWGADFRQLDLAHASSRLRAAATENTVLLRVDCGNRMHQRAMPVKDCQTFGILAHPQAPGRIGHRVLDSESLLFIDPCNGLDAVVEPGFTAYTFSIRNDRLRQLAELQELPAPIIAGAMAGSERPLAPLQLATIRSELEGILLLTEAGDTSNDMINRLESELPALLLKNWVGTTSQYTGRIDNRTKVLQRALEFLEANRHEPLTVEHLRVASASSLSTLERAFRDQFGVSPKRYLMLARFSGVRRALLDSSSTRSISDVANAWGFWHMGKFAADYRRIFGQLPSQTPRFH
jgi:AraC-like DNA-binding protein